MAEENIDKKKIDTVKLLLSSLFARKQKYLIVDGKSKNRLIYANFPYERTIYYRPTPEDAICGVTVNDELVPLLHEAFPLFDKVVAEIDLMKFMSAVNKCLAKDKTKWPVIDVDKDKDLLSITTPEKDMNGNPNVVCVGRLLPPDALEYYEVIMNNFLSFSKDLFDLDLKIPESSSDDPVMLADLVVPATHPVTIKLPMRDGVGMISFKEYLKKRALPLAYKAHVQYRPETQAAKVSLNYEDDWLRCVSMMPGTLWFPFL